MIERTSSARSAQRDPQDPVAEPSGAILARLLSNIASLLRIHALLSGQEARAVAREIVRGLAFIGVAVLISIYMVGLLVATAVLALSLVMRPWAAALTVLGATVVAMALLFFIGVQRVRARVHRLGNLIRAFKEDVRWLGSELFKSD